MYRKCKKRAKMLFIIEIHTKKQKWKNESTFFGFFFAFSTSKFMQKRYFQTWKIYKKKCMQKKVENNISKKSMQKKAEIQKKRCKKSIRGVYVIYRHFVHSFSPWKSFPWRICIFSACPFRRPRAPSCRPWCACASRRWAWIRKCGPNGEKGAFFPGAFVALLGQGRELTRQRCPDGFEPLV